MDPGSYSWDFVGFDDDKGVFLDTSIPTKRILKRPEDFFDLYENNKPFDLITAPSGFGLPLKNIRDMTEEDLFYISLKRKNNKDNILGLSKILTLMQEKEINAVLLPGVKHLPTVSDFRKVNKIDLGTADKVCSAVVGIRNQMEEYHIKASESSFIMVEMGYAFTAVLAIEKGRIIDGIGGSNIMGFRAVGSIDGEIAYLMGKIKKHDVYQGGVSSIAGYGDMKAEEIVLLSKRDKKTKMALNAYYDRLSKAIYAISSSFEDPDSIREILLAGRLSKYDGLVEPLCPKCDRIAPSKVMRSYAQISKESAQGAAFIANGLLGGKFKDIVDNMRIKESSGNILDNIYLPLEK
ncbi:MAG: DUF1464 family protein [Promethearchaeota archaeon]